MVIGSLLNIWLVILFHKEYHSMYILGVAWDYFTGDCAEL